MEETQFCLTLNMDVFWQAVWGQITAFSWVEWAATLIALGYVWLTSRQQSRGWWWGVVSCALWAYASFFLYQLYLDAILQIFYVVMGVWGWYQWKYGGVGNDELPVSSLPFFSHALLIGMGVVAAVLLAWFFDTQTLSAAPWWNAPLTVFSILATFLLIKKKWEVWIYWIVIDIAYGVLYSIQGACLFALVMMIYVVIAVKALSSWRAGFQKRS